MWTFDMDFGYFSDDNSTFTFAKYNNLGDICRINISIDLKPHYSDLALLRELLERFHQWLQR